MDPPFRGRRREPARRSIRLDFKRGFHNLVDVWGADHDGHVKRVDDETGPGDVEPSARCPQVIRAPNQEIDAT